MNPTAEFAADLSVSLLRHAVRLGRRAAPGSQDTTIAYLLGKLLLKGKKEIVIARMKNVLGFSFCSDAGWTDLWRAHLRYIGRTLNESNDIERMHTNEVVGHIELEGEEILREATKENRGAMVLIDHSGNGASIIAGLGHRDYNIHLAVKPFRIPSLERRFSEQQRNFRSGRVPIGRNLFLTAARTLHENGLFAMTIDYFASHSRHVCWLQFGDAMMLVNLAPAMFALQRNTPIIFVTTRRRNDGKHALVIHPNRVPQTGDLAEDATRVTSFGLGLLIDQLRASPSEWWIWDHAKIRANAAAIGTTHHGHHHPEPFTNAVHSPSAR